MSTPSVVRQLLISYKKRSMFSASFAALKTLPIEYVNADESRNIDRFLYDINSWRTTEGVDMDLIHRHRYPMVDDQFWKMILSALPSMVIPAPVPLTEVGQMSQTQMRNISLSYVPVHGIVLDVKQLGGFTDTRQVLRSAWFWLQTTLPPELIHRYMYPTLDDANWSLVVSLCKEAVPIEAPSHFYNDWTTSERQEAILALQLQELNDNYPGLFELSFGPPVADFREAHESVQWFLVTEDASEEGILTLFKHQAALQEHGGVSLLRNWAIAKLNVEAERVTSKDIGTAAASSAATTESAAPAAAAGPGPVGAPDDDNDEVEDFGDREGLEQ